MLANTTKLMFNFHLSFISTKHLCLRLMVLNLILGFTMTRSIHNNNFLCTQKDDFNGIACESDGLQDFAPQFGRNGSLNCVEIGSDWDSPTSGWRGGPCTAWAAGPGAPLPHEQAGFHPHFTMCTMQPPFWLCVLTGRLSCLYQGTAAANHDGVDTLNAWAAQLSLPLSCLQEQEQEQKP